MPILNLKDGTTLILTDISKEQLLDLENLFLNKQITTTDLQHLASQIPTFRTREDILLMVDRCTQFTDLNDINKVYLFAVYVQEIIKTQSMILKEKLFMELCEKINAILQLNIETQSFNVIKGYYFIFLNKLENATFLLERCSGYITEVGLKVISTMNGKKQRGSDKIDTLCNWYLNRKDRSVKGFGELNLTFPRLETLVSKHSSGWVTLDSLIEELTNEEDIAKLKGFLNIECEGFLSDLNYIIGKWYHTRKDYLNAKTYYKKSVHPSAVYNYMRITREIVDTNVRYRNILNYIYLITNQNEKIINADSNSIYKVKKEERWCGHATMGYFSLIDSNEVSKAIVVNNLAYFYMKCLKENEIGPIKKLLEKLDSRFGDIRKNTTVDLLRDVTNNIIHFEDEPYQGQHSSLFYSLNLHIASLLSQFNDPISLYNLSFFLKTQPAIKTLRLIKYPTANTLLRLSILLDTMDIVNELVLLHEHAAIAYIGYYHLKHKNIKHAKESFKSLIQKTDQDYALYGYLSLSYICHLSSSFIRTGIEYLKKALSRFKNSYVTAYNLGVMLSMEGEDEKVIKIFDVIRRDERNSEKMIEMCNRAVKGSVKRRRIE